MYGYILEEDPNPFIIDLLLLQITWLVTLYSNFFTSLLSMVSVTVVCLTPLSSKQQGEIYDSPASVKNIPDFIEEYGIKTDELLEPDITKYANFNDFFARCSSSCVAIAVLSVFPGEKAKLSSVLSVV